MTPTAVVLVASDDPQRNLSHETWMAWTEPPVAVTMSILRTRFVTELANGGPLDVQTGPPESERHGSDPGNGTPQLTLTPYPHVRQPHAAAKRQLDGDEIREMLDAPGDWELAVPNHGHADVLTKDALAGALDPDSTGTVTITLTP